METTRQNKIARLIQKELSEIFMLQTKVMKGVLVTVSVCRISPDMSICRVYLSVFPSAKAEEIIKNINENAKAIRFDVPVQKYLHCPQWSVKFAEYCQ